MAQGFAEKYLEKSAWITREWYTNMYARKKSIGAYANEQRGQ